MMYKGRNKTTRETPDIDTFLGSLASNKKSHHGSARTARASPQNQIYLEHTCRTHIWANGFNHARPVICCSNFGNGIWHIIVWGIRERNYDGDQQATS